MNDRKVKPGLKTTEAWATIGAALVIALNKRLDLGLSDENCALLAGLALAWVAGRSYVKGKVSVLFAVLGIAALSGCASFRTSQTDKSEVREKIGETNRVTLREITTRASGRTFFEAKSALTEFKALQTDKTQSATVGKLANESTATNVAPVIEAVAKGVVEGLKGGGL